MNIQNSEHNKAIASQASGKHPAQGEGEDRRHRDLIRERRARAVAAAPAARDRRPHAEGVLHAAGLRRRRHQRARPQPRHLAQGGTPRRALLLDRTN